MHYNINLFAFTFELFFPSFLYLPRLPGGNQPIVLLPYLHKYCFVLVRRFEEKNC